jgi:hypothetical protein
MSPVHNLPDLFVVEVLARLDPADCAVPAQVGQPRLAAVLSYSLPRAGETEGLPLELNEFV